MNKTFILLLSGAAFFAAVLFLPATSSYCSTEDLVLKTERAVGRLASGDAAGAVSQVVPTVSYQVPQSRTGIYVTPSGRIGVRQPVPGASALSNRFVHVNSSYNAGLSLPGSAKPRFYQNVNLVQHNRFFTNSTTFNPNLSGLKKGH